MRHEVITKVEKNSAVSSNPKNQRNVSPMRGFLIVAAGTVAILGILVPLHVRADSSGPNNGSTFENDASIGSAAWGSPSDAQTSNNAYANTGIQLSTASTTNYLKATGFGFSIPAGATINGIKVEVERSVSAIGGGTVRDAAARIVKGGTIGTTDRSKTDNWSATESYFTYGGTTDLWGETWTAEDVNASNFGFAFAAKEIIDAIRTARVDHIRITVSYTPGAAPPTTVEGYARRPGTVVFTGKAFPQGTIQIYEKGLPLRQDKIRASDGSFSFDVLAYRTEVIEYNFIFLDKEGRSTPVQSFATELSLHQYIDIDLSPPPTISLQKSLLTKGESLLVTGAGPPRTAVEILADNRVVDTVTTGETGTYAVTVGTTISPFTIGPHTVAARRKGKGNLSLIKQFVLSSPGVLRGDFNSDGAVNLADWSIFLVKREDPSMIKTFDLNEDRKVNVIDLSIFLRLLVAGR